eukprot:gene4103-8158_t
MGKWLSWEMAKADTTGLTSLPKMEAEDGIIKSVRPSTRLPKMDEGT